MSTSLSEVPLDTYWGIIQSGARARLTTSELWSAINHSLDLAGERLAPGAFQRMNQLRGLAGEQIRADKYLARLDPTLAITINALGLDINSRDAIQRGLNPRYRVSFDVTGTRISSGAEVTIRLTDTFGRTLPGTKQDLLDTLGAEAPALAQDSDLVLTEISGNISIRAV